MKKVMVIVFCYVCVLASIYTVNASSYLNQFGVNIEQSIYEKMSRYYDKEYIDIITKEQYESIVSNDFENIVIISSDNAKVAKSSSELSTDYKTLKLIVNGNFVTASLNWKKQPKVKNYYENNEKYVTPGYRNLYKEVDSVELSNEKSNPAFIFHSGKYSLEFKTSALQFGNTEVYNADWWIDNRL